MTNEKDIKEVLAELEAAETMTAELKTSIVEAFAALAEKPEPTPSTILNLNTEDFAGLSPEDKSAIAAFLKRMGGKLGGQATAILQRMAGGAPTEDSGDDDTDDFTEQLATMRSEMEEQFSAKLTEANDRTKKAEEQFAAEKHARRLSEFTDHARGYSHLAVETEKFGEDLLALADHDAELYTRLTKVLKAANETIKQGAIFDQFSVADRGDASGEHPFLRKVEELRRKEFGTEEYAEGFTKAMVMAEMTDPDLANRYERETRLTDNG